jgi:hypothetical protein
LDLQPRNVQQVPAEDETDPEQSQGDAADSGDGSQAEPETTISSKPVEPSPTPALVPIVAASNATAQVRKKISLC